MKNLKFAPAVFVVGDNYDIVTVCPAEGKCYITVGNEDYYESGSGIFKIHTTVHKITVPQNALDAEKKYTVHFFPCPEKKPYWTEFEAEEAYTFDFKPIEKEESINIYYTADIHACYEEAVKCCTYFGDKLDMLVVNGDYGESRTTEDIEELGKFISDVTGGSLPTIIGRGNHDTRGNMSEFICDYISTDNGKTYYTYNVGPITGVVLDSGEDKVDSHKEYGKVNYFERYRREELKMLQNTEALDKSKYRLAFCHNPFTYTHADDIFNIDKDVFEGWSKELERIGIEALICGHLHKYYLLPGEAPEHIAHTYPIVVGSAKKDNVLGGTAITLMRDKIVYKFTDAEHNVTRVIEIPR